MKRGGKRRIKEVVEEMKEYTNKYKLATQETGQSQSSKLSEVGWGWGGGWGVWGEGGAIKFTEG